MTALQRTPLYETHVQLGARLVEFAGFEMPVHYGSILKEHAAVRQRAGIFDVSHMGQIHLAGPRAVESAERLVSCPVASLRVGRVRYGLLCNEEGGVVDDVTVYRLAADAVFFCVNASNIEKDYRWIVRHAAGAEIRNRSAETGLVALQGPRSVDVLSAISDGAPGELPRFGFAGFRVAGCSTLVSRTGYTGSDGFEIYLRAQQAPALFEAALDKGRSLGLEAAGLGARDTLRLEAALPLYGHELDDTTSPLEAGLERFVKRSAGGFLGALAIEERAAAGLERRLIGFELEGRGVARPGYPIRCEDREVGRVTSGAPSPTLGKSIGLGYVPPALGQLGSRIEVRIRQHDVAARVVDTPFVVAGRSGDGDKEKG